MAAANFEWPILSEFLRSKGVWAFPTDEMLAWEREILKGFRPRE